MKKRYLFAIMLLALIAIFCFQGCWAPILENIEQAEPEGPVETDMEKDTDPQAHEDVPIISATSVSGRFILRYDPKSTLNPITTLNRDNILLSSLLYESLFVLDGKLQAKPLLCKDWSTEDNMTFTFEIEPDIVMHDGSIMTADDVVYSLKQSMQKGRYVNRFKTVESIKSDGELTVTIALYAPNSRFINLLDVPIIKSGSIDQKIPPGTGAYIFNEVEEIEEIIKEPEVIDESDIVKNNEDNDESSASKKADKIDEVKITDDNDETSETDEIKEIKITKIYQLIRFIQHRDFSKLPLNIVYLRECSDSDLTELFDNGELSLLWDDPSDPFEIRINRLPEKHFYDTTALQFVGFNARDGIMRDPDVRRAISASIDRQYIVDNILTGQQAIPAPLALSPDFWLYDKAWERRGIDPLVEMSLLLVQAGLEDFDNDSFLEISDGFDDYKKFSVDFIVNIENEHRTKIANMIADTLRRYGFNINVRELTWENYINALKAGRFDMYYGEIVLNADFDLSPLLLPGALNYGKTASTEYLPYIDDFLAARSDNEIKYAAKRLCDEVTFNTPFAPVLYKKYAIYFPMGAISGADPSQTGVFHNFADWTVDLTMLT